MKLPGFVCLAVNAYLANFYGTILNNRAAMKIEIDNSAERAIPQINQ